MEGKYVKYRVFLIFIFVAIILYFAGNAIAEYIYDRFFIRKYPVDQLMFQKLFFTVEFWGIYILLLLSIAVAGMFLSRDAKKKEVYKGFKYSMILLMLMLVVYLTGLVTIYLTFT